MISDSLVKSDRISEVGMQKATQPNPDADAFMERVGGVLTAIACLTGYTTASVEYSTKWILIVRNMADTRRNLH